MRLNGAGYDLTEAVDADHAIAILEVRRDIRVVFTDIQLPGSMDGLKLAHAIRHRWPPVHIVATSAYNATLKDELPTGSVFLPKPYTEYKVIGTLKRAHRVISFDPKFPLYGRAKFRAGNVLELGL